MKNKSYRTKIGPSVPEIWPFKVAGPWAVSAGVAPGVKIAFLISNN